MQCAPAKCFIARAGVELLPENVKGVTKNGGTEILTVLFLNKMTHPRLWRDFQPNFLLLGEKIETHAMRLYGKSSVSLKTNRVGCSCPIHWALWLDESSNYKKTVITKRSKGEEASPSTLHQYRNCPQNPFGGKSKISDRSQLILDTSLCSV